jgi:hypothetical protein
MRSRRRGEFLKKRDVTNGLRPEGMPGPERGASLVSGVARAKDREKSVPSKLAKRAKADGAPGGNRTPGLQVRSLSLYPSELRARGSSSVAHRPASGNPRDTVQAPMGDTATSGRGHDGECDQRLC